MVKPSIVCSILLLVMLPASTALAQDESGKTPRSSGTTVTAFATGERVRFTAPSSVVQMRLEVYGSNGEKLFDNELKGGNVLDWLLQNGQAERLAAGSYLCVVTVKSLSGKITQKLASLTVGGNAASLHPVDARELTAQQAQSVGPVEANASMTILKQDEAQTGTVIAHNGEDGEITRGKGALVFRLGDFYSGKDTEQMRLTADGNLGIGITHPQARLDVDGLIHTNQGILFPDGTIQATAAASATGGKAAPGGTGLGIGKLFKGTNQGTTSAKDGNGKKKFKPELNVNEDLTVNGNIIFTSALARDITMQQNIGGVRIFAGPTLTATAPSSAAIQFFGNGHAGFPGQAYIDSGAHDSAAIILRTTGTGGTITERMRVTATGDVGIGTSMPQSKLHIFGSASVFRPFRGLTIDQTVNAGTDLNGYAMNVTTTTNAVTGTSFLIDSVGNVGIGTASPGTTLDVRGQLTLDPGGSPTLYTSATSGEKNRYLQLINSPSSPSASGLKAGGVLVADSYSFANPGKNDLIVKGNVGIGTTTPTVAKLVVNDTSVGTAVYGNSTIATGVFGQASVALFGGVEGDNSAVSGIGVIGKANAAGGVGVYGRSDNGVGVNGISANGFAMRADGNTYQQRDKGGWVKAMIQVGEDATILNCYSGLTGASLTGGTMTTGCGFSASNPQLGFYIIDFGFQITDRFISATAGDNSTISPTGVTVNRTSSNSAIRIQSYYSDNGDSRQGATNTRFYIFVF